ncbi:rhomboid family protein [Bacillus sp. JCM 19045]|nr:rhomboid family protein [Bacillus sp. JCM 19045]
MFIRNETFSSYIRKFPIVSGIIALTVFIHFILLLLPSGFYFRYLGIGLNSGIEAGEYWRLVTPIFLHGDLFHLIFNMGALLIFAPALEGMLGRFKFALIYLIPGILANVATYFLEGSTYSHVGASGSIFGLFGVFLFMYLYRNDLMDRQSAQAFLPILIISLIMTFINSRINVLGHLFGLGFGVLFAPLFLKGARPLHTLYAMSRSRKTYIDDDDVSFNPNRWKNRQRNSKLKKVAFIIGALVILFLLYLQFSATYY